MPKIQVEVDETEFVNQQQLAVLYQKMMQNPKARQLLTESAKIVNPNAVTPELDAKNEVLGALAEERAERIKLQEQIAADRAARDEEKQLQTFQRSWEDKRGSLRKLGYTDDGIEKIEQLAQERGIVDLEAAAALFDRMNPPQQVTASSGFAPFDTFNPSDRDNENFKALMEAKGDDPMTENKMIREALDDYRSGRTR